MTHEQNWFPKKYLIAARDAQRDWKHNWKTYLGIAPSMFLRHSHKDGAGVTVHHKGKAQPGLTFMTGFFNGNPGMVLVDLDGKIVHHWPTRFSQVWKDVSHIKPETNIPVNDWTTHIHGAVPLPDGSVVYNFADLGLVKQSKCGNIVWKVPYMTHHSVELADDGTFWVSGGVFRESPGENLDFIKVPYPDQTLLNIGPDGKILTEISLLEVLAKAGMFGQMFPNGVHDSENGKINIDDIDMLHLNDIEPLDKEIADNYPLFNVGDILVSTRNNNMIAVLDGKSFDVKWYQIGPWIRQHDPDFLKDGRIAVYNNNDDGTLEGKVIGESFIMIIDPVTGDMETAYGGSPDAPFYSKYMGKIQFLDNNNLLITETVRGRVFEVSKDGEIVWEYISRFDDKNVMLLQEGTRYRKDYFNVTDWECH